jgi:hypothetical protein
LAEVGFGVGEEFCRGIAKTNQRAQAPIDVIGHGA